MDEKVVKNIIKLRKALRHKYLTYKRGLHQESVIQERKLQPVTKPLKELVDLEKKPTTASPLTIKEEKDNPKPPFQDLFKDKRNLDTFYGLKQTNDGSLMLGSYDVKFDNNDIIIGGEKYNGTPGLVELLILDKPTNYTEDDLKTYQQLLLKTGAHLNKRGYLKASQRPKFLNIIKPLFEKKVGGEYRYWDDPNELVNRLRLLNASTSAGHTSHQNEIIEIIDELREAHIIQ